MRLPCLSLLLALAASAGAQTTYDRTPGETLRYREVTEGATEVSSERGAGWIDTFHDATLAVTFGRGDSARAVYEALDLGLTTPRVEFDPDTDGALGLPFELAFPASGRVRLVSAPVFPDDVSDITDLTRQFDDFFLPLPAEPLAVGLTWTDSTRTASEGPDGEAEEDWSRGTYEVVADTVEGGRRVLLVEAVIEKGSRSVGTDGELGLTTTHEMAGTERSVFAFAPDPGVLVWRDRTGRMAGRTTLADGEGSDERAVTYAYESTIDLVESEGGS
jgi:hypothetical protein